MRVTAILHDAPGESRLDREDRTRDVAACATCTARGRAVRSPRSTFTPSARILSYHARTHGRGPRGRRRRAGRTPHVEPRAAARAGADHPPATPAHARLAPGDGDATRRHDA